MIRRQVPKTDSRPRLQKVLASAGVGSRRECEELIVQGRVEVNEVVADKLGTRVDPATQRIRVDGVPLQMRKRRYFAVHKPPGVLSTSKDPWGRARVIDLVDTNERLFSIGRLDKDSSGLILVTNDGELANQLTHPRYGVHKTYSVTVAGTPSQEVLRKVRRGVMLAEGPVKPESVTVKKRVKNTTQLEIVLAEGRNREIRRMLARFDHKVMRLHRIAIGPIRLGMLPRGDYRELTSEEIKKLRVGSRPQKAGVKPNKTNKTKKSRATKSSPKTKRPKRKKRPAQPKMGAVLGAADDPSPARPRKRKSGGPPRRPRKTKRS